MNEPIELTENKKITFSLPVIWTGGVALVGFVMWLSMIYSTANANARKLDQRTGVLARINDTLSVIDRRLSTIEGYLKGKEEQ